MRRRASASLPTSSSRHATLLEIVRERPTSPEALRRISGVGEKKLVNYGDAVLDIVAAES